MDTTRVEQSANDRDRPTYAQLLEENRDLKRQVGRLERQVEKLTRLVEKLRRQCRRQAAPFRKQDEPPRKAKKPGRKAARRHGRHAHRNVPPRIDERHDVPLPEQCPHCGDRHVQETHVVVQYQTEIPRTVIYRQFDIHVGRCDGCGRTVQGRHGLQTSAACGAAASQLGPNVHAAFTILNKQLGLSHGKSVKLLSTLFEELSLARATSVRSIRRTARHCQPAYQQLARNFAARRRSRPTKRDGASEVATPGCTPSAVRVPPVM